MDDRPKDVLLVGPRTEAGWAVVRERDERVEVGEVRPVREGQPLHGGDLVKLRQRPEHERLFDVETLAQIPSRLGHAGPAQVATDAYREGWDAAFGSDSN